MSVLLVGVAIVFGARLCMRVFPDEALHPRHACGV